jgi:hypothetical protein
MKAGFMNKHIFNNSDKSAFFNLRLSLPADRQARILQSALISVYANPRQSAYMPIRVNPRLGQSLLEMVIIGACVILVLLVMGTYIRQAMSGKLRGMVDSATEGQFDPASGVYVKVSNSSGISASRTVTEHKVYTGSDINYTGYSVMGGNWTPLAHNAEADVIITTQEAGDLMAPGSPPVNTTEVEHFEGPWQDL